MSDTPDKTYLVSLPMSLGADSPQDAIAQFVEQINTFGLRAWSYNVVEQSGDDLGETVVVTGRGVIIEEEGEDDGADADVAPPEEPTD